MTLTYSIGSLQDSQCCFLFIKAIMDYGWGCPRGLEPLWQRRRSMFEFLAHIVAQFWAAERDVEISAYARSIVHDGLQEMTEFFVSAVSYD